MEKCIDDMYSIYDMFDKELKVVIIERQEYALDEFKEKHPNIKMDDIPKK